MEKYSDFQIDNGVLVMYKGEDGDVVIPDGVTAIGERAFYRCEFLSSVTIPTSVASIGEEAFDKCDSLFKIFYAGEISNWCAVAGLENIMSSTRTLYINGNEPCGELEINGTVISDCAFFYCRKITGVKISSTVESIGRKAFEGCIGLTCVTISDGVTSIGEHAFCDCGSLTGVEIPIGVSSIGAGAFDGCRSMESISVSSGNTTYHGAGNCIIETVTKTLVAGCKNSVIPTDEGLTAIGDYAFCGCRDLTSIEIPNTITSIGSHAFYGCGGLTCVTIPNTVTSVGDRAFYGCRGVADITIPNSVTSIGDCAFLYCGRSNEIIFDGTKKEWEKIKRQADWHDEIGDYTVVCTDGTAKK